MEVTTTCQICERIIKSNTGVLAHHGYQRPGDGWQTPSCLGARTLPYEVSRAALPPAIEFINNFLVNRSNQLHDFLANPPETLTYRTSDWKPSEIAQRPRGFVYDEKRGSFSMGQRYEMEYHHKVYVMRQSIEQARRDVKRLKERLTTWKQVWTEKEFKELITQ
jgi:hypothetical protein